MKYRFIASDIDGTLLPIGNREFSPATLDIARRCREKGIYFTLSSGRSFTGTQPVAVSLGITCPIMTCNGSVIMSVDGEVIKSFPFDKADACFLYEDMRRNGLECRLYCTDGVYAIIPDEPLKHTETVINGHTFVYSVNETALFETHALDIACKAEAYSHDTALLNRLLERYSSLGYGAAQAFPIDIELTAHGVGKGSSLLWLSHELGVSPEETVAFGDNTNDLDMLRAAGLGVAVGNAAEPLRLAADMIAPDSAMDGVAVTIDRIIAEEI